VQSSLDNDHGSDQNHLSDHLLKERGQSRIQGQSFDRKDDSLDEIDIFGDRYCCTLDALAYRNPGQQSAKEGYRKTERTASGAKACIEKYLKKINVKMMIMTAGVINAQAIPMIYPL